MKQPVEGQPIPRFMERGSDGPHTVIPQLVAAVAGFGKNIVPDGDYGEVTTGAVSQWQASPGLESDGGFGPQSRAKLLEKYGIDFEAYCRQIPGTAVFVQPDGASIPWTPDNN